MEDYTTPPLEEEPVTATGLARDVTGQNIEFHTGIAASVTAEQNLTMERAAAMVAHAGQDMQVAYGGASTLVAGRDMKVEQGGGQVLIAGNDFEITNGGGQLLIAGNQATINKGVVVAVISRQVNLGEGTRVLLNTPQAIMFGAVAGLIMALFRPIFSRNKKSKKR